MRRDMIGYRESPDGGERHVHFEGDSVPPGWRVVRDKPIPGPPPRIGPTLEERVAELERQVRARP